MTLRARTAVRITGLALVALAIPSGIAGASTAQLGVTGGTVAVVEVRFVAGPGGPLSGDCPPAPVAHVSGNVEWAILTDPFPAGTPGATDCPPAALPVVSLVAPL